MNYLLSIIIPTKNRYNTLLPLVDYLLTIKSEKMELLIQDNSDDISPIQPYLNKKENYISYFHSPKKLSQTENSNLAVSNCKGEYVCFIGDDDGVMPYIIDVVEWMKDNNIEAVKGYKPNYSWPGLQISYLEDDTSGVLRYKIWENKITTIDCKKELNRTLSKGGSDLSMLPCLYHGIVSKKTLEKIYEKTGSYFPGPSPDMANAIALCFYVDNYKYLGFPLVISGKSSSSIGGKGVLHKHISRIEDVNHLPETTKRDWNDKIPKYWTGPTIWCESVIKSLEACGEFSRVKNINFSYLYAELFVFEFKNRKHIFNDFGYNIFTFSFFVNVFKIFSKRVFIFFSNRLKVNTSTVNNLKNIGQAVLALEKVRNKKAIPFKS